MHTHAWRWALVDVAVVATVALMTYLSIAVWQAGISDISIYAQYAHAFWLQVPRFQRFPLEYPPLALLPFALTLLAAPNPIVPFSCGMAVLVVALYVGMVRWSGRRAALICLAYLLISEQAMLVSRFDIVPALLTVGALWAAQRRHFGWAHVLLGLGVLVKLYPIFLVPLLLIAESRLLQQEQSAIKSNWRRWLPHMAMLARRVGTQCTVIGVGALLVWWRNPTSVLLPITYAAHRPAQVESLLATIAWFGSWFGMPLTQIFTFGSVNWIGPLPNSLLPWTLPALALGCVLVYLWQWRGKMSLPTAFLAVLCVVLLTNRVFSTQYLIWAVPFIALAEGLDLAWIVLCLLQVLVDIIYPYSIPHSTPADVQHFIMLVAVRNVVLLGVTVRLFVRDKQHSGVPIPEYPPMTVCQPRKHQELFERNSPGNKRINQCADSMVYSLIR